MSKVFRLYKEGAATYEDWNGNPSFPYNSASRDTITDPDGASARHEITSIPSPFARIDLIKTAFKEVCKAVAVSKDGGLDGKTIYHKMVSDTLDVAEIFFNIDKYNGKIEVIKWDSQLMLAELDESGIAGHRYLADALRKYMETDAKTYNFGLLHGLYLLNYVEGPDELNIIGATSPATLFFSNANDLSYVKNIYFGEDVPFDNDYQPLYKRDFEFIKYLFVLRKSIPNFSGLFREVDDYLTRTYSAITDQQKKNELNQLSEASLVDYAPIVVTDKTHSDNVEVLGYQLYKKTGRPLATGSDFLIKSDVCSEEKLLVLPVESGNRYSSLLYTTAKWGKTNQAPFFDKESDLSKRLLPCDGAQHPYVTISDFLEPTLIIVPNKLNSDYYFDGSIHFNREDKACLLPLKPLFFKFFTVEQLLGEQMADGTPMFEMEMLGVESVKATLRIPIKGNNQVRYICYTRIYNPSNSVDLEHNDGNIAEISFTGLIMPLVRFNQPKEAIYNVACIKQIDNKTVFRFFNRDQEVLPTATACRNESREMNWKSDNYMLKGNNFDFIQVSNQYGYCGLLVPKFQKQMCTEEFKFAIDLGTSNTHIEVQKNSENPRTFETSVKNTLYREMFIPARNEEGYLDSLIGESKIVENDFLPAEIGVDDFHFPTRTVLSCAKSVDWSKKVEPFMLVNLPLTYEKRLDLPYNNLKNNIKWGKGDDLRVMEAYVHSLMLMIRNMVLVNNGDLKRTQITWFYPISMAPKRFRRLKDTWNEAYQEYFNSGSTVCMTESEAPIQYVFQRYAMATSLVNVDIGGGTTDVAFAKDKQIQYVTSFRYASNTLFEDSYSSLELHNGIVDHYKESLKSLLQSQETNSQMTDLLKVFESPSNQMPANMASFLFALKDNTILQKQELDVKAIDFNYLLQEDEDFKIVFIVFYTSIIYHIAHLIKVKNLDMPRHISFSGNGSKVIRIITSDKKVLANYTKLIFEKVLGKPYDKELELLGLDKDDNPKVSTCKGGLLTSVKDEEAADKIVVLKSDNTGLITPEDTYGSVTSQYKNDVVKEVSDFFHFVFEDMNKAFDFDRKFGVEKSSFRIAKEVAAKDLSTYLDKGLALRMEEAEDTDVIEETFFFYPIKGVLQAMSNAIKDSLSHED